MGLYRRCVEFELLSALDVLDFTVELLWIIRWMLLTEDFTLLGGAGGVLV